jgi:sarcosine oxidase subunit gamma
MYSSFQQTPADPSVKKRLSMHHISKEVKASNEYYSLEENERGHLNIRVKAENQNFINGLLEVTGLKLPTSSLGIQKNDQYTLYWISPDEFLLLVPVGTEFKIENQIRAVINESDPSCHFAILNVSSAQTILTLSGSRAESILKKSTPYNIHPSNLPLGKVVTTVFAKTQVVLSRTKGVGMGSSDNSEEFTIIVRRSFSDYVWRWIVDAGKRE